MAERTDAYLLVAREDGYGDVVPLRRTARTVLGRANTNPVVLKDDLASREHAEVFYRDDSWYLRDLGSLNGTRLNGTVIADERALVPPDEVRIGKSRLVFVESLDQIPSWAPKPKQAKSDERVSVRKKLSDVPALNGTAEAPALPAAQDSRRVEPELARLYRLALAMGAAETRDALVSVVLNGLLDAVPAEVGAILGLREPRDVDVLAYRTRGGANGETYHKVSRFVSNEVIESRAGLLADDVPGDSDFAGRDSLAELRARSLVCVPVLFTGRLLALIHLYSTREDAPLTTADLEFTLAVAHQFGAAWHGLEERERLSDENRELRDQLRLESEVVGQSPGIQSVLGQVSRVARTSATVLVRGESGSGKELVARALHFGSPRKGKPFVTLNCAALTETLLESELFGHEKGAFTGATDKLVGKFEAADGGTIFLDEIGEMAAGTQAKFLRVLEGHPFERVGGNTPIRVDVRVVAATNRPLEEAVRAGTFRRDLYFRLQVVELRVPPLRERPGDVVLLAEHFLQRFSREMARKMRGFSPLALSKLQSHTWPGNVRELRNAVERAVALSDGPQLEENDIWLSPLGLDDAVASDEFVPATMDDVEKRHILRTLQHTDWNKSQASQLLGIERSTLDRKIKGYDLRTLIV